MNKQLFYNIDALNVAINQGCKVSARMMEYGMDHELVEKQDSPIVFSPYVTLWAEGNYYILVKREGRDDLEHIRVDHIKDIVILGFNPGQYAKEHIFQNGEKKERHEIECSVKLWQDIVDTFGKDAEVVRSDDNVIRVKIMSVPSVMRTWVLGHIEECEVTGPKRFGEEIRRTVMEAYRKYCC